MKRSRTSITNVLFTSILATGMSMLAGQVSAQPADLTAGYVNSSDAMLYAAVNLKGRPPYKRHVANSQQLEKAQFFRFEEKSGVAKDGHKSMYHGARGKHPPYSRNR